MRVKVFAISGELLELMFLEGSKKPSHTIATGWPEGCQIRDIRFFPGFSPEAPVVEFLLEHESFPELSETEAIWQAPHLDVTTTTP